MISVFKTVNFGSARSGLSTVGYALISSDGSTKQARTTSGVTELHTSTGIYGATINFDDGWNGMILWDTGEATPKYGSEDFNFLQYGGGAGYAGVVVDNIWTKEEKDRVFKEIASIKKALGIKIKESIAAINGLSDVIIVMGQRIEDIPAPDNKDILESLNKIRGSIKEVLDTNLEELKESSDTLAKGLSAIMKSMELKTIIEEVDKHETVAIGA